MADPGTISEYGAFQATGGICFFKHQYMSGIFKRNAAFLVLLLFSQLQINWFWCICEEYA